MKKIKTALATGVVLAFGLDGGLFAADTTAPAQPKTPSSSANSTLAHGWYGPGFDGGTGYFNPALSGEYNPYPFYNIVGGESYGPLYTYDLPDQNESPYNPHAALTHHSNDVPRQMHRTASFSLRKNPASAAASSGSQDVH